LANQKAALRRRIRLARRTKVLESGKMVAIGPTREVMARVSTVE